MRHPAEFLEPILSRPFEDAPRLRYAGWLEERVDPLGEFIRLQCALAKQPLAPALEARQLALWSRYHAEWSAAVADLVQWASFRRGFIEEVALSADQLCEHADDLFRHTPLQELHLEPTDLPLERLPAVPDLGHSLFLDLSSQPLGDAGLIALAQSPFLAHVHGLNLGACGIGDAGLRALGESPYLEALRELYLCENGIGDVGVRHFALSPLPEQLDTLYLRNNPISDEGIALLQKILGGRLHVEPASMAVC